LGGSASAQDDWLSCPAVPRRQTRSLEVGSG
jgi:hypothetical protein